MTSFLIIVYLSYAVTDTDSKQRAPRDRRHCSPVWAKHRSSFCLVVPRSKVGSTACGFILLLRRSDFEASGYSAPNLCLIAAPMRPRALLFPSPWWQLCWPNPSDTLRDCPSQEGTEREEIFGGGRARAHPGRGTEDGRNWSRRDCVAKGETHHAGR